VAREKLGPKRCGTPNPQTGPEEGNPCAPAPKYETGGKKGESFKFVTKGWF